MNIQNFIAHPWHGVDPEWKSPLINGIVEIPRGSRVKYEMDKKSGLIKMDRLLNSSFEYPINYGFIPKTLGLDGDPLDILVMSFQSLVPLCLVKARVIGLMEMEDCGIKDDKIIAVAEHDISVSHIKSLADIPEHFLNELRNFFEEYTKLENKIVVIREFKPLTDASLSINTHLNRYEMNIK